MRRISMLVVHHSAGASGTVEVFRRMHRSRGFSDIGYHEVIGNGRGMPDGHIGNGRPHSKTGAGVYGANAGKLQVCLVGNFEREDPGFTGRPTRKQLDSLGHWLAVNAVRYRIYDADMVAGHREVALPGHGTACPGSAFPMGEVRAWFEANVGLFAAKRQVRLGEWISLRGRLH